MSQEVQYITKTDAAKQLGVTLPKLGETLKELKIETITSNKDRRIQYIKREDLVKIKNYYSL